MVEHVARLALGITKSLAWKMAIKNKVPEDMRKIALGQAPLWSTDAPIPPPVATAKVKVAGQQVASK